MRIQVPKAIVRAVAAATVVAAVMAASAAPGYGDPSFGVRPGGPSGLSSGDIFNPAPGAPKIGPLGAPVSVISKAALGLPATANVNDITYGDTPFPLTGPYLAMFSVAPGSTGHPAAPPISPIHPDINQQLVAKGWVAGDIYSSYNITGSGGPFGGFAPFGPPAPCGPVDSNIQVVDVTGLPPWALMPNDGLGLNIGDSLNKIEVQDHSAVDFIPPGGDGLPDRPVFFSVDASTAAGLPPLPPFFGVTSPADVLAWDPSTSALYDWAPAGMLGITPADQIDALKVGHVSAAPISAGWIGAPDTIIFSFKPGSPSNAALGSICYGPGSGTPGDVYQASGPFAGADPVIDAEMLGLSATRSGGPQDDDLAALDLVQVAVDTDGDGCANGNEIALGLDPLNPWDFYSVPVPALFAALNPLLDFKDSIVNAGDAQAVFSYFKMGAHAGTLLYDQDLNGNGIKDGIEYDRSVVGPGMSGPPTGVVSAAAAQVAFAQFKKGYKC